MNMNFSHQKIIVSNTDAINTGRGLGAVTCLLKHFEDIGLENPVYLGCKTIF